MIEQIKAEILRQNPDGFPVPRFAGERELGEEYRDVTYAVWDFPEFKNKALFVPFSLTGVVRGMPDTQIPDILEVYAAHVVKSAVDSLAVARAESKGE